ncbi:hypothetical protein ES703_92458 [subsurface metagenome]
MRRGDANRKKQLNSKSLIPKEKKMKKLIIALMLALVMVLVPSSVALAGEYYDVEDPCVADNEDFSWGWGNEGKAHFGEQFSNPALADGYNLYQDIVTDTGNLDWVCILTSTPDEIDLPIVGGYMYGENPDTWYWDTGPRGYNFPAPAPAPKETYNRYSGLGGVFWVEVFNYSSFDTFKWDDWSSRDRVLAESAIITGKVTGVNAVVCTLYIPEGTHLSYPGRPGTLTTHLIIEREGTGVRFSPKNMDFSQPCTLKLVYPDGTEEVVDFTQIRDGQPS